MGQSIRGLAGPRNRSAGRFVRGHERGAARAEDPSTGPFLHEHDDAQVRGDPFVGEPHAGLADEGPARSQLADRQQHLNLFRRTLAHRDVCRLRLAPQLQHVAHHHDTVVQGRWAKSRDFSYWDFPLIELAGHTLGIIGFGGIGRAVADIALAMGMKVLVANRSSLGLLPDGVTAADLETVLSQSDVITLHTPLTPETELMINASTLALMKPSAYLINTSRGGLVDEQALADALNANRIAGAGLDVLTQEPADPDCPLIGAKNCTITPHIAWATQQARSRLIDVIVQNVKAFLDGKPINVVN